MNATAYSSPRQEIPNAAKWPELSALNLSPAALANRFNFIGGSDANIIFSGDAERTIELWREKSGQASPKDLTGVMPVMLGCWTEEFNRQWYQRETGLRVSRVGEELISEDHPWRRCTLDGYVKRRGAVWEAKHTNAFNSVDDVLARYMPQLQHNMAVARSDRAYLSVIFGNHKWEVFEVAADWLYQEELLTAESRFLDAVLLRHPPVAAPPPPVPKPVGIREICLEGNNAWAAASNDWLENAEAARRFTSAAASLKQLVEPDVARAYGHGVEAKRSKSGAVSIKECA